MMAKIGLKDRKLGLLLLGITILLNLFVTGMGLAGVTTGAVLVYLIVFVLDIIIMVLFIRQYMRRG